MGYLMFVAYKVKSIAFLIVPQHNMYINVVIYILFQQNERQNDNCIEKQLGSGTGFHTTKRHNHYNGEKQ